MPDTDPVTACVSAWAAAERAGDADALDGLLTDDFLAIGPMGFTLDRQAWIGRHRGGGLRYSAFDLDEVTARPHGDSAVVTARQTSPGTVGGVPIPEVTRVTLALVADADRWQLARAHISFVAGTPGSPPLPDAARAGRPAAGEEGSQ